MNFLRGVEASVANIRGPDGSGVVDGWFHKSFIGPEEKFFLATLAITSQGAKDSEFLLTGSDFVSNMGVEAEMSQR